MINKEIIINKKTRKIINGDLFKLGVDGENLQENIIFKFEDEFVNGTARIEITMQDNTKSYVMINKVNETYILPVKSILTKKGLNKMQLVITQGTDDEEIPIFKSEMFNFFIAESINADTEQPEEYPQWIDEANTKLNELDNLDIDAEKVENTTTITITKKDETQETVNIYDGEQGETGPQGPEGPAGKDGVDGKDGKDGENGQDGFSPVVSTSKSGSTTTIEITDANGTHIATINDGVDGVNGTNGQDGYSPSASVSQSGDTTTISITDKNGTTSASINLSNKQDIMQYNTMPIASSTLLGKVVQYVGTTTTTSPIYVKGSFYKCVSYNNNGTTNYKWTDVTLIFSQIIQSNNQDYFVFENLQVGMYNVYETSSSLYYKLFNTDENISYFYENYARWLNVYMLKTIDEAKEELSSMSSQDAQVNFGYIMFVSSSGNYIKKILSLKKDNTLVTTDKSKNLTIINNYSQIFAGEKKFSTIPQQTNTTAPTNDKEFTNKKYVDDQITARIGSINTILATLTTPSNNS